MDTTTPTNFDDVPTEPHSTEEPLVTPPQPANPSVLDIPPGELRVIKRTGEAVHYEQHKIYHAIIRAFIAVEGQTAAGGSRVRAVVQKYVDQVTEIFKRRMPTGGTVHIEDIQDQVELALMRDGQQQVARRYVLYREERARVREEEAKTQPEVVKSIFNVTIASGETKPLDIDELRSIATEATQLLDDVDAERLLEVAIESMYEGIPEEGVYDSLVVSARAMVEEEPNYTYVAARLLLDKIRREALPFLRIEPYSKGRQRISHSEMSAIYGLVLSAAIERGVEHEFLAPTMREYDFTKLGEAIQPDRDLQFDYLGLQTLYDRYFLHKDGTRFETPQVFFMRVAMGLALDEDKKVERAIEFYDVLSQFDFMSSTPTLFNSGTLRSQLSSCYLTTVPDDLDGIYSAVHDNAMLSKWAGGLGNDWTNVRALGSYIKGTNGQSQGIVPFLKVANDTAVAVNQCFSPETRVHTADGIKEIQDVTTRDLVLGQRGEYRRVLDTMSYRQDDSMVQIGLQHSSSPLRVTSGHPVLAARATDVRKEPIEQTWIEAGDLRPGDFVAQVVPQEVVPVPHFTDDDARMYGLLLGGGAYSEQHVSWTLETSDTRNRVDVEEFVTAYLSTCGIEYSISTGSDSSITIEWSAHVEMLREASTGQFVTRSDACMPFEVTDFLDENGEKRISRRLNHLPKEQTIAMLRGLVEATSTEDSANATLTDDSDLLVEGVRYQLLRLGIPSRAARSALTGNLTVHLPTTSELSGRLDRRTKRETDWIRSGNHIYTRVLEVAPIEPSTFVHDLKVEGDESYMTTCAVAHNGGKRNGAVCAYLETWHLDIEEFLSLRKNTGDDRRRTHDMDTANWVPDLFMKRVTEEAEWTLFTPSDVPDLHDLYGQEFERRYLEYEAQTETGEITLFKRVKAVDLWKQMLSMLYETGHPWITFKDPCNIRSPQQHVGVVHSSNLCTEITLNTAADEIAVCNLGSVNLVRHIDEDGRLDKRKLKKTVRTAIRMLDNVIDINYYAVQTARSSNLRHRPIGLGLMGFHAALFKSRIPYGSQEAVEFSDKTMEAISYYAIEASCKLARERGTYQSYEGSLWSRGILPIDSLRLMESERGAEYIDVDTSTTLDWDSLRTRVVTHGMRNSNVLAIAPTATIANITGVTQSIQPIYQNLYTSSNLSGEFTVANPYLVRDLKQRGLWDQVMVNDLKYYGGSVKPIDRVPADLKELYATAFEIRPRWIVQAASRRQKWIDQSQSLNLFIDRPSGKNLDVMYRMAWQQGLKTTYYLRSFGATSAEKSTVDRDRSLNAVNVAVSPTPTASTRPETANTQISGQVCSLDDDECEACQ